MVIKSFISKEEQIQIISFVNSIKFDLTIENVHIKNVAQRLNGNSYMFDITGTPVSNYLSTYQSSNNLCTIKLPEIILKIKNRISKRLSIPDNNVFLQILDMNRGGKIFPHYDTSIDGYINYKCNVSVLSEDYSINIDGNSLLIKELDMYSFEASLYKHWTDNAFNKRRILLSFGYGLKYKDLGRSENDYRIRLSKRINKRFQV